MSNDKTPADKDWPALMRKYIRIVILQEGVDFIHRHDFTDQEWEMLLEADPEIGEKEPKP